jgi:hypothetical protein
LVEKKKKTADKIVLIWRLIVPKALGKIKPSLYICYTKD